MQQLYGFLSRSLSHIASATFFFFDIFGHCTLILTFEWQRENEREKEIRKVSWDIRHPNRHLKLSYTVIQMYCISTTLDILKYIYEMRVEKSNVSTKIEGHFYIDHLMTMILLTIPENSDSFFHSVDTSLCTEQNRTRKNEEKRRRNELKARPKDFSEY